MATVNADSIGLYLQSLKDRYKTNWMGTTKSKLTGKTVRGKTYVRNLDVDTTSVEDAITLFNQGDYAELMRRPEGADTRLRFHTYQDLDSGDVFVQIQTYVSHNVLGGVTDVVELTGQEKDDLLALIP